MEKGIEPTSEILWGPKDIIHINPIAECLIYNKHSISTTIILLLLLLLLSSSPLLFTVKISQPLYSGEMDQQFGEWAWAKTKYKWCLNKESLA